VEKVSLQQERRVKPITEKQVERILIKFKLSYKVIQEIQLPFCSWVSWDTQIFLDYISNFAYINKR
jgi:hypothetical protein